VDGALDGGDASSGDVRADVPADAPSDAPQDAPGDAVDGDAGYAFPTPIRYVVVILKENHTFDSMFTGFPGIDSPPPAKVTLKDGTVMTRKPAAFAPLAGDTTHANSAVVKEYNGGKMNGWSATLSGAALDQAFTYYPEAQIPSYWAYARNFVLFDHFFSTFAGPSSPGHFSIHTATSIHYENPSGDGDCANPPPVAGTVGTFDPVTCTTKDMFPCFDVPVVEELLPAPLTWRAYGSILDKVKSVGGDPAVRKAHYHSIANVLDDLDKDDLANVTMMNISGATYNGDEASEHPPQHPCNGENLTVEIVNRLMKSKHWPHMAIVFSYDDFGGWYDHVAPKIEACPASVGGFYHTGFRLPALVISSYAKNGVVDHTKTEHASIPRLIEDLFGLPRLTANPKAPWNKYVPRDATAGSMMGAFDFTQPPRPALIRPVRTDCPKTP
jgi:phospholipase C